MEQTCSTTVSEHSASFAGDYRTLPVVAQAMYAPVVSANTDARRLVIQQVAGEQP